MAKETKGASKKGGPKKDDPEEPGPFDKFKKRVKEIGGLRTTLSSLIVAGSSAAAPWLHSSKTLRITIVAGLVFGGILGYLLVPLANQRSPRIEKYILWAAVCTFLFLFLLVAINPANRFENVFMRTIQDFLMYNMVVINVLAILLAGGASFCIVSLVCVAAGRNERRK